MTIEEYFGNWMSVIDKQETIKVMKQLQKIPNLCPSMQDIFKAFTVCPYKDCKVVCLGQDPYPQKGVALGIAFGNSKDTPEDKVSPSLRVLKECAINYELPHNHVEFDNTLESWANQGILLINSALTCEMNNIGSHVNLWRPFITKLFKNLSINRTGLIYVLFGRQAQFFKSYINKEMNDILEINHPSFYARTNTKMPYTLFKEINQLLKSKYNTSINWYKECLI